MSFVQYQYNHRKLIGFLVFFLIIYGPYVQIGLFTIQTMRIIGGILVWYFICLAMTNKVSKSFIPVFNLLFVFIIYVLFRYVTAHYQDNMFISSTVLLMYYVIASYTLAYYSLNYLKLSVQELLHILFLITVINSIILIIFFFYSPLRSFMYKFIVMRDWSEEYLSYRMVSINGTTASHLSFLIYLGAIAGIVNYQYYKRKLVYILSYFIILFSMIITGRSGMYMFFIIFPIVLLIRASFTKHSLFSSIWALLFSIVTYLLIVAAIFGLDILSDFRPNLEKALYRSFSMYYQLTILSLVNQPTIIDFFEQHFFLPDSWDTLMFGCGTFGRNIEQTGFYLPSDVGYIKNIFGFGLTGIFLQTLVYIYMFYQALKRFRINKELSLYVNTIIFSLFIIHIKSIYFGDSCTIIFLFGSYFFLVLYQTNSQSKKMNTQKQNILDQ